MARPPERTLTALLSPFARSGAAEIPTLLVAGRADRAVTGGGAARAIVVGDGVVVGRGTTEVLADDALVSGRHAQISRGTAGYEIVDLGSKNGTFVEGRRLSMPAPLVEGMRVFIGNHAFVFRRLSALDVEALAEEESQPFGPVATVSPGLARACQKMRRLAITSAELFLAGETGVGKEVYARAVHQASGREGRFVAINCAALPRELLESELFGFRPGAHSTAHTAKSGLLEEAEGGTLFMDEIGEMSPDAQSKVLRFLQDKEIVPLGGTRPRRLDVRVIAATNRPVGPGVAAGVRDDLLARLGAAPLRLPPLRDRIEDLGALVNHFAVRPDGAPPVLELPAFRALALYHWPLNVRELEKLLGAALALTQGKRPVALLDLPEALAAPAPGPPQPDDRPGAGRKPAAAPPSAAELEVLLERHGGQVADVSRALGRQRAAVWRWIKQFGLKPDQYRPKSR